MKQLLAAMLALSISAFGATEDRPVTDFEKIELEGYGTLTITQGDKPSLTVTADEGIIGDLKTEVDDKKLTIRSPVRMRSKHGIAYEVTVTQLREIAIDGAAEVKSNGTLMVDKLILDIEGAAKADLVIKGSALKVEIDGAGHVTMAGVVDRQEIEIDGAGKYLAFGLDSERARIEIDGAGKANVQVSKTLDVEVNGAGSVTYQGDPKITQKIRGIGSVTQAN